MASVEGVERALRALVAERQTLRERAASRTQVEANRLEIVRLQWQLSYALIGRHLPERQDRAAA